MRYRTEINGKQKDVVAAFTRTFQRLVTKTFRKNLQCLVFKAMYHCINLSKLVRPSLFFKY